MRKHAYSRCGKPGPGRGDLPGVGHVQHGAWDVRLVLPRETVPIIPPLIGEKQQDVGSALGRGLWRRRRHRRRRGWRRRWRRRRGGRGGCGPRRDGTRLRVGFSPGPRLEMTVLWAAGSVRVEGEVAAFRQERALRAARRRGPGGTDRQCGERRGRRGRRGHPEQAHNHRGEGGPSGGVSPEQHL